MLLLIHLLLKHTLRYHTKPCTKKHVTSIKKKTGRKPVVRRRVATPQAIICQSRAGTGPRATGGGRSQPPQSPRLGSVVRRRGQHRRLQRQHGQLSRLWWRRRMGLWCGLVRRNFVRQRYSFGRRCWLGRRRCFWCQRPRRR